ncbi:FaeA/PapI family transcriptional regulator [Kosakonia sacchari]|uniref:FaeA/PapI family transcriptional regulator n=1 Tax=Kosakonia sacchari TaxID=1158459 RepID=UPI002ACDDF3E|nr:FaeA/PapI family transcriptional regulator [Kosakonia sacchari]MDZ7320046.1 FaeA/PapI family transcriptional regulator [Kosakonia sacchari]
MSIANDNNLLYTAAIDAIKHSCSDIPLKINQKMIDVFLTIIRSGNDGLTTRMVADNCDMSVYAARNWLIRLEDDKLIERMDQGRNARWVRANPD